MEHRWRLNRLCLLRLEGPIERNACKLYLGLLFRTASFDAIRPTFGLRDVHELRGCGSWVLASEVFHWCIDEVD